MLRIKHISKVERQKENKAINDRKLSVLNFGRKIPVRNAPTITIREFSPKKDESFAFTARE